MFFYVIEHKKNYAATAILAGGNVESFTLTEGQVMLTRKQYALLMFIHDRLEKKGISPSFDEMRDELHLKSKSGVHRLVLALEERGFVRRLPNRARALEIIRMPENVAEDKLPLRSRRIDMLESQSLKRASSMAKTSANDNSIVAIPLYGRIAAGTPIEALKDENDLIDVPQALLGSGKHYALEIEGDSMIDKGIHDGDTVIIEHADSADKGDIVVAFLAEDNEATLKIFERKGNTVILHPANKHYKTRQFAVAQVQVQGKLKALLRKY